MKRQKLTIAEMWGLAISAGRKLAGLDQGALAALAKVSQATVSKVERGETEPRADTLKKLRRALRLLSITVTLDATNGNIVVLRNCT